MYTSTSLNRFWLWSLFISFGLVQAQAQTTSEPVADITFEAEKFRYEINLQETVQQITVCGLVPGLQYDLVVNPAESAPDCVFLLSPLEAEQINIDELDADVANYQLSVVPQQTCRTISVINSNCYPAENYPVHLTILDPSCKATQEGGYMPMVQAIYVTDATYTTEQLITQVFIAGGCFDVLNVQGIGNPQGRGYFAEGNASIGIDQGVILANGDIDNAPGPNTGGGTSTNFGDNSGDPDLDLIGAGAAINDAVGIEFDFVPSIDQISFNYVFASEEYCEFVNSSFNDVFGFFISGPGITGPFTNEAENIALLPSGQFVGINTVNHLTNQFFFNSNSTTCGTDPPPQAPDFLEYDGFTVKLTAVANVIPCETYHIRLVVADAGDNIYDSAVFLEANSFTAGGEAYAESSVPGTLGDDIVYEGCGGAEITFNRWGFDYTEDLVVNFGLGTGSTATEGVDFIALPDSIIIPAGQGSLTIPLIVFEDFLVEGVETIIIELTSSCACFNPQLIIEISDMIPLEVAMDDLQLCDSGDPTLVPTVSGGVTDYEYLWSDGSTDSTLSVSVNQTSSFSVTVTDVCGNTAEEIINIEVTPTPSASLSGAPVVCEESPNAQLQVDFTGEAPWEFSYVLGTNLIGPIVTSDNPYFIDINTEGVFALASVSTGLCAGPADGSVTVDWLEVTVDAGATDVLCYEVYDGTATALAAGAIEPYTYNWSNGGFGDMLSNLGPGTYTVTATDAIGCTEETTVTITQPTELTASVVATDHIDCQTPEGSADLTFQGGTPIYDIFWDNGSDLEDPTDLFPGDNYVVITDLNGCTVEVSVFIEEDYEEPIPYAIATGVLDCNNTFVIIDASGSTGVGALDFEWYDPLGNLIGTDPTVTVTEPGNYLVFLTDQSNGCFGAQGVDVIEDQNVPMPSITANGIIDCISVDVTLDGSGSSGTGPLSYQWQNPSGGNIGTGTTVTVNTAGTYTLIITDDTNGCTSETTYDVTADTNPPSAVINSTDTLGCVAGTATLDGSGSSGSGVLIYQWLDSSGTPIGSNSSVDVTTAGNYTLVITDNGNGCTATTAYAVPENTTPPPAVATVSGPLTCVDLMVTLTGEDGNGQYDVQWFDSSGAPIGSMDPQVDVNNTGSYTFVVTNPGTGCTADANVSVSQDIALPTAEAGPNANITCDSGAASLDGTGSSSGSGFTYEWFNANNVLVSTDLMTSVTEASDYTLVVTNTANGCTASDMVSVTPDINLPTVNITTPNVLNCTTNNTDIIGSGSGTGTLAYEWSDPSGSSAGTTPTINVTIPGVYTLIVTNTDNGCSAEASIEVLEDLNLPVPVAVTPDLISCTSSTATLDASGSTVNGTIEYEWFDGGSSIGTDVTVDVNAAGTYTLVITDSDNGCTATTTVDVPEDMNLPQASADVDGLITCIDEMVSLDGSNSSGNGTITFEWFDGSTSLGTDPMIDVSNTGTYTLVITDIDNGCTSSTTIDVTDNLDAPTAVANADDILDCVTASVTLDGGNSSGSGSISYEWLDDGGSPIGSDPTVDVNAEGTYTLVITNDINGCTASTEVIVASDTELPEITAEVLNELTCVISTANLTGSTSSSGTFEYSWLDDSGTEIGTTQDLDVGAIGTYTFVVTNSTSGCSSEMSVEVTEDMELPNVDAGLDGLLTCDVTDVTLSGSGDAGTDLEWFSPTGVSIGTSEDVTVEEVGTYILVATNPSNGCTLQDEVEVVPDTNLPTAFAENGGELNCTILSFTLDGSGSSANGTIAYEWFDAGGTMIDDNALTDITEPGIFTLVVTDTDNGCTASISVEVTQNLDEPSPVAEVNDILDCVTTSVTLNGGNSSGPGGITYEWFNPNGSSIGTDVNVDVSAAGDYILVVTNDGNGCASETSITVEASSDFPIVDATALNELTCVVLSTDLEGSATGTGTFSYSWLDPTGTEISTDLNTTASVIGTYTFIATNIDNNCSSEVTVEVTEDLSTPESEAGAEAFLTCDITTVTLSGSGTGAVNLTYEWLNPSGVSIGTDPDVDVTESGTYTLIVTNAATGCTASDQTQVSPDANLPVAIAGQGGELTCANTSFLLDGSGSSANGTIDYQWLDVAGNVLNTNSTYDVSATGIYTLLITDTDNGCTATSTVEVTENILDPSPTATASNIIDCATTSSILDGNGSTGTGALDYVWMDNTGSPLGTSANLEVSDAGIYTLQITDQANGCTSSTTVEVFANDATPDVSATALGQLTCASQMIELQSTASGTGTNITYSWQFPAGTEIGTDANLMATTPGIYTLVITDGNNFCTNQTTVQLDQDINDPVAATGNDQILTCDVTSVTLSGTGSSTGSNITYEWTNPAGVVVSTNIDAVVSAAGNYILLVTNMDNGCTSTASNTVTPDSNLPTAFAAVSEVLNCDVLSATLDGSGSSNGSTISYEWFDGAGTSLSTDLLFDVNIPGTYTLVVSNSGNGCSATYPVDVLQDIAAPTADAGTADILNCDVTTVTLDGSASTANSGVLSFEWLDPTGLSISATELANVSEPGIYELIVTAENGCTNSASIEVEVDAAVPVADAGMEGTLDCATSSLTIGGSNTSTGTDIIYEWFDGSNTIVGTTATIDVSLPDIYTLVVTNTASNCSSEQAVEIFEDTLFPVADSGPGGLLTCATTEITLGGVNTTSGSMITYSWTDITGTEISTDAETLITIPGTYTLLVSNTENSCTATSSIIIDQDIADPSADAGADAILTCDVTSVTLDGTGSSTGANFEYQWYNASNTPLGDEITLDVSSSGDFTLIVTNATNGCTASSMVTVTPDAALPTAIAGMGGTLTCTVLDISLDGNASSTVSGQIEYEWFNAASQTVGITADLNVSTPGVYTLVISDPVNGCSTTDAVEVMQDIAVPEVFPGADQILNCGTTSLDLLGSAGNGTNFSYEWFDPNGLSISTTAAATATISGVYTLEVLNIDNGCNSSATLEVVPDINLPTAIAGPDGLLTCVVSDILLDGTASSSNTGGVLTYQWLNDQGSVIGNTASIMVSGTGSYTLIVIDSSNDCESSDVVEVTQDIQDPLPEIIPVGPSSVNCTTSSVLLDGSLSTPMGNVSYLWSTTGGVINGSSTGALMEAGGAGTYTLTVTNLSNGCESNTTYTVGEDFLIPIAVIGNPLELDCNLTEFDLNGAGSSTGTDFTYSWQGPAGGITGGGTTLNPTIGAPGTYTLTVINDDNGCENTASVTVLEDINLPNAVANVDEMLDCVTESLTISGTGSAAGTGITYLWDGPGILSGATTLAPEVNAAGFYTLTVMNSGNGCVNTTTIEVEEDDSVLSGAEIETGEIECFGDYSYINVVEVIGGTAPFSYSLDNTTYDNAGFYVEMEPGNYTLYIEDAIGCHFEQQISIAGVEEVTVDLGLNISLLLGEDQQLHAEVNLLPSEIDTIVWTPTDSLSCDNCLDPVANPYQTTSYMVTVTNLEGCSASAEVLVVVDKDREVYIPNAFSPNADGFNDYFTVYANERNIKRITELHVYNRWGEVVFENSNFLPNDELEGWNGMFRGDPMTPAVFVYWLEVEYIDGAKKMFQGDLTLFR